MAISSNIGSYHDVATILDAALGAGGGRYKLESPAKAYRWRARAYKLRSLLFELKQREYAAVPGLPPTTPYDHMLLRLDGDTIIISFSKPTGQLTDFEGKPIMVETGPDTLLDLAKEVALDLGIE